MPFHNPNSPEEPSRFQLVIVKETKLGTVICTDLHPEVAEGLMNRRFSSWTKRGWTLNMEGLCTPVQCPENTKWRHYVLEC